MNRLDRANSGLALPIYTRGIAPIELRIILTQR
jgi:hypothetical protein